MRHVAVRAMLLNILVGLACVQMGSAGENESGIKIRGEEIGLKVGERIPDFEAPDQSGKTRAFKDLRGPKGLLFIIYRSAGW